MHRPLVLCVLLLPALSAGCSVGAAAVTVAGASVMNLSARESEVTYPATALELATIVERVFDDLGIEPASFSQRSHEGVYRGLLPEPEGRGREIELAYEVLGERELEIGVRAGWLGDENWAATVHEHLRSEFEALWLEQSSAQSSGRTPLTFRADSGPQRTSEPYNTAAA